MLQTKTDKNWWDRLEDLSTNQRAGLWLFVVTSVGFGLLALLAAGPAGWLAELDLEVQGEIFELRSPWADDAMVWITGLGSRWFIGSLLLVLGAWVVRTGRCRKALSVMVIAFLANPLLEAFFKFLVGRPRPTASQLLPGNGPAFPSGHVLATVGFYGVLAAVAWRSTQSRSVRIGAYLAATSVIVAVGFSRIYLGVHWFTDVVGGMLVGTAFVLAVAWSLRGHHFGGDMGCEVQVEEDQPLAVGD